MNLLLDTNALIWFLSGDSELSGHARSAIEDGDNTIIVSAVSAYEIDWKRTLGKRMPLLPADLEGALGAAGFKLMSVSFTHASAAARLPPAHKDP